MWAVGCDAAPEIAAGGWAALGCDAREEQPPVAGDWRRFSRRRVSHIYLFISCSKPGDIGCSRCWFFPWMTGLFWWWTIFPALLVMAWIQSLQKWHLWGLSPSPSWVGLAHSGWALLAFSPLATWSTQHGVWRGVRAGQLRQLSLVGKEGLPDAGGGFQRGFHPPAGFHQVSTHCGFTAISGGLSVLCSGCPPHCPAEWLLVGFASVWHRHSEGGVSAVI